MARILTGIQPSGRPHLGNVLGAIRPALDLASDPSHDSFLFIADLHALTSVRDASALQENIRGVAAAWLAMGFDPSRVTFYRQSAIPEVTELAWILTCQTPLPMLENAHSYKDKTEKLERHQINAGLFTYPVLMTADILGYDAQLVPVGKDQRQHLEIARDIASSFNHQFGETFVVPEARINEAVMTIPGTDGRKMSKSYDNILDPFAPEKELKKQVGAIVTDSTPLEDPKNPDEDNVFAIYSTLATKEQSEAMRQNYLGGGYGYGHAKKELLGLILDQFGPVRAEYDRLLSDPGELERQLAAGNEKARAVCQEVMGRVKAAVGL